MRRILIEHARRRKAHKRGGDQQQVDLSELVLSDGNGRAIDEILVLDEALKKLQRKDKLKAGLVKLRFYAGLTLEQSATSLRLSLTAAKAQWAYARAWLLREIS